MDLSWLDFTDMRIVGGAGLVLAALYLMLDAYVSKTRDGEAAHALPLAGRFTPLAASPPPMTLCIRAARAGWFGFWLQFR